MPKNHLKRDPAERLGELLDQSLSRLALGPQLQAYGIWAIWNDVVGRPVARNAQPLRLDTRRLVVVVKNAMWMHELSLLRRDLCARLNQWMGREVVSEVFLVIGRVERQDSRSGKSRAGVSPAPEPQRPADVQAALDRLWSAVRERDGNSE